MPQPEQDVGFPIEELLTSITGSLIRASTDMQKAFAQPEWRNSPFIYHIPRMSVSIRLSLAYTTKGARGIIRRKENTQEREMETTIEVEVAAVPNPRVAP